MDPVIANRLSRRQREAVEALAKETDAVAWANGVLDGKKIDDPTKKLALAVLSAESVRIALEKKAESVRKGKPKK
jgi:hypothetical protein